MKLPLRLTRESGFSEFLRHMGSWQPRPQGFLVFQYAAAILENEKTLGTRLRVMEIFGVQPEGSWESFKKAKAPDYRSALHE